MEIIKKDFNNRTGNNSFKLCAITNLFFAYPLTALSNLKQYITCRFSWEVCRLLSSSENVILCMVPKRD